MFSCIPKPKRFVARTLAGLLCLALAFLFLACPMSTGGDGDGTGTGTGTGGGTGNNTIPLSTLYDTWTSQYGEGYTISRTALSYDSGFGEEYNYAGNNITVVSFNNTNTAGVIIFRYTKTTSSTNPNPEVGKYTAVYYRNLTTSSVDMATANLGVAGNYETPTANSLSAAKLQFTADKAGDYVSMYGSYTK
jgi:hypothetical protein